MFTSLTFVAVCFDFLTGYLWFQTLSSSIITSIVQLQPLPIDSRQGGARSLIITLVTPPLIHIHDIVHIKGTFYSADQYPTYLQEYGRRQGAESVSQTNLAINFYAMTSMRVQRAGGPL